MRVSTAYPLVVWRLRAIFGFILGLLFCVLAADRIGLLGLGVQLVEASEPQTGSLIARRYGDSQVELLNGEIDGLVLLLALLPCALVTECRRRRGGLKIGLDGGDVDGDNEEEGWKKV